MERAIRPIDANALEQFSIPHVRGSMGRYSAKAEDWAVLVKKIREVPTLDYAPVVHAHWLFLDDCSNAGVYCSHCLKSCFTEAAWYKNVKQKSPYCPNCGAKMDGGDS